MLSPRVLLLPLMLVSSVGLAQSPPPLVPAAPPSEQTAPPPEQTVPPAEQAAPPVERAVPPTEQQPAPQGELIPHPYEPELVRDPSISAARVMLELLGGAIGGVGGAVAGGLFTGVLLAAAGGCSDAAPVCGLTTLVIMVPSIAIGTSLGVSMFGRFLDGEGLFSSTMIGLGAGVGAALLAGVVTTSGDVLTVSLLSLPLIGAIIGYELSHANVIEARNKPTKKKKKKQNDSDIFAASTGPQWSPLLGTTAHGGFFGGVSGRF